MESASLSRHRHLGDEKSWLGCDSVLVEDGVTVLAFPKLARKSGVACARLWDSELGREWKRSSKGGLGWVWRLKT